MADFVGFVGDAYTAPSIYQDAQELINWYLEDDSRKFAGQPATGAAGQRGETALYPTPGYTTQLTIGPVAEVRGMKVISGGATLLVVIGAYLYSVNSSFTATLVGTLNTAAGVVTIDDNGAAAMICDGANRYGYTYAGSVFAVLTDGAFTTGAIVHTVDNFFLFTYPGTQQFSASTALSTATPTLSFASKFGYSDQLISMMVIGREAFLLGEVSSEVWIDGGLFPFPFQILPGSSTQNGCAAAYSVSKFGNSFAMLGKNERGQGVFMAANGYGFQRISTHSVEQSLVGKTISDARSFTYQIEGHEFYVTTFPTADLTWVYDGSTQKWHKWLSVDAYNVFHRHRANCYALFQGLNLIGDYQNGNIYALSNTVYQENGNEIRRMRRCPHLVSDFNNQFFERLQIQFQPGVGLESATPGLNPQAMLRWSDDGGSTWSNEHWRSIGTLGAYKNRAIWRRMGYAKDRVYEFSVTDPVNCTVISADLVATPSEAGSA